MGYNVEISIEEATHDAPSGGYLTRLEAVSLLNKREKRAKTCLHCVPVLLE